MCVLVCVFVFWSGGACNIYFFVGTQKNRKLVESLESCFVVCMYSACMCVWDTFIVLCTRGVG